VKQFIENNVKDRDKAIQPKRDLFISLVLIHARSTCADPGGREWDTALYAPKLGMMGELPPKSEIKPIYWPIPAIILQWKRL